VLNWWFRFLAYTPLCACSSTFFWPTKVKSITSLSCSRSCSLWDILGLIGNQNYILFNDKSVNLKDRFIQVYRVSIWIELLFAGVAMCPLAWFRAWRPGLVRWCFWRTCWTKLGRGCSTTWASQTVKLSFITCTGLRHAKSSFACFTNAKIDLHYQQCSSSCCVQRKCCGTVL